MQKKYISSLEHIKVTEFFDKNDIKIHGLKLLDLMMIFTWKILVHLKLLKMVYR